MSHDISLPEAAPSPPPRKKRENSEIFFSGGRVRLNVISSVAIIAAVSRGARRRFSRKYFTCVYDSWLSRTTGPLHKLTTVKTEMSCIYLVEQILPTEIITTA